MGKKIITITIEDFLEIMQKATKQFVRELDEMNEKKGKENNEMAGLVINLEMISVSSIAGKMLFEDLDTPESNDKDMAQILQEAFEKEHGGN